MALGFLLFAVGIVLAVVGGAKAPVEGTDWPDTLLLFGAGVAVGITGLVIWHRAVRKEAAASHAETGGSGDPESLIARLQAPLDALGDEIGEMAPEAITHRVDDLLVHYVLPFAEVRQKVIGRFGMEKGAEILVTVAFGERLLNRVWSAAGDGHVVEARRCFPEAHGAFREAARLFEAAA